MAVARRQDQLQPPISGKRVRLRVVGGHVNLDDEVPPDPSQCPTVRPCPHVRCRFHLWRVDENDRRGRRFHASGKSSTTLRMDDLVWRWPLPPSCHIDVLEAHPGGMTPREVADVHDLTPSMIGKIEARIWRKLRTVMGDEYVRDLVEWLHRKNGG